MNVIHIFHHTETEKDENAGIDYEFFVCFDFGLRKVSSSIGKTEFQFISTYKFPMAKMPEHVIPSISQLRPGQMAIRGLG